MERKKCFVIMPISDQGDYEENHFTKVYEQIIKPSIIDADFEPYRVDENKISESIMSKIYDAIQNCEMAVCDLSNHNPNVLYELGLRHAYDKPVVLIQDEKTSRIFDISGINTVTYSSTRIYDEVMEARTQIRKAISETFNSNNMTMAKIMKVEKATIPEGMKYDDILMVKINQILGAINNISKKDTSNFLNLEEMSGYDLMETCAQIATKIVTSNTLTHEEWKDFFYELKNYMIDIPNWDQTYFTRYTRNAIDIARDLYEVVREKI